MLKVSKNINSIIAAAIIISLWACTVQTHKTKTIKLPQNISKNFKNKYNMSLDGTSLMYLSENVLFKFSIPTMQVDSVFVPIDIQHNHIDITTASNEIMLLAFEKKSQYDNAQVRYIKVFKFNYNLNLIKIDSFRVDRGINLLEEDFNFTNYYYNSHDDKYIINDLYGNCLVVNKHIWDNQFFIKRNVDPITGITYDFDSVYSNFLKLHEEENREAYIGMQNIKQFSILGDKILFYNNNHILYGNIKGETINHVSNTDKYNICRRFENGTYRLKSNEFILVYKIY